MKAIISTSSSYNTLTSNQQVSLSVYKQTLNQRIFEKENITPGRAFEFDPGSTPASLRFELTFPNNPDLSTTPIIRCIESPDKALELEFNVELNSELSDFEIAEKVVRNVIGDTPLSRIFDGGDPEAIYCEAGGDSGLLRRYVNSSHKVEKLLAGRSRPDRNLKRNLNYALFILNDQDYNQLGDDDLQTELKSGLPLLPDGAKALQLFRALGMFRLQAMLKDFDSSNQDEAFLTKAVFGSHPENPAEPNKAQMIFIAMRAAGGDQDKFEAFLDSNRAITTEDRKKFGDIVKTFRITQGNRAITKRITQLSKHPVAIARMTSEELIVDETEIPEVYQTGKNPREDYFNAIHTNLIDEYQHRAVTQKLLSSKNSGIAKVNEALSNIPEFNFLKTPFPVFKRENPEIVEQMHAFGRRRNPSLSSRKTIEDEIIKLQQMLKLSPCYIHVGMLDKMKENGIHSAQQVVQLGRAGWNGLIAHDLPRKESDALFNKAQSAVSRTVGIRNTFKSLSMDSMPAVFKDYQLAAHKGMSAAAKDLGYPDWKDLFGSFDYCECKPCDSIFSPGAYLKALLDWLKQLDNPDGSNVSAAFDELKKRRGDIWHIDLNCENAMTPMPYISLAIEVMEWVVAKKSTQGMDFQTNLSAPILKERDEHTPHEFTDSNNQFTVYEKVLSKAVYPWSLPYDHNLEQSQLYLHALHVPRYELLKTLNKSDADLASVHDNLGIHN